MSKWSGGEVERVKTAARIKRYDQTDKPLLAVVRDLNEQDR